MNSARFDRFSQPQFLQRIGRERVTQILSPFHQELLAHGMALPAAGMSDDIFFMVLAALPQRREQLSAGLLDAMTAIEVIEEVLPDERAAHVMPAAPWPLVAWGLNLRLCAKDRPILLMAGPAGQASASVTLDPTTTSVTLDSTSSVMLAMDAVAVAGGADDLAVNRVAANNIVKPGRMVFRQAGSHCEVIFDGSSPFHLPNKLGAKYIDYWLHHANESISAFDLERVIQPEKARARAKDSIQGQLDAEAVRQYLRELDRLRARREEAVEDGDLAAADRLDVEMAAIEAALKRPRQASDAGERARVNVNKAVTAILVHLRKGGAAEQAFGRHLEQFLSLGYECCYHQPPGISWAEPRPGSGSATGS